MSSKTDINKQINRGLAWVGAASSVVWILDLLGMWVVLHFFVSKEQLGAAWVAVSLFKAIDLASELGLSAAIIQRDDHSRDRLSTLFWVNVSTSVALAAFIAFGLGPVLSWAHKDVWEAVQITLGVVPTSSSSLLTTIMQVYALKLLWQNVITVPESLMKKQLRFKELSIIRTLSNVAEFAAKIGVAASGFGIWAFVFGPMARVLVAGVGVQMRNPWFPRFVLSLRETRDWIAFGIKSSAGQLLYELYTNLDYQVVAIVFGPGANGAYTQAYELVIKPCQVVAQTLAGIALPAYSRLKLNRTVLFEKFLQFSRLSLVVMLAVVVVVFVCAKDILILYRPEFAEAASTARILCGVAVLRAVSYAIPPLLDAQGRPGLTLRYNVVATLVLPPGFYLSAIWLGPTLGYDAVAWGWLLGYPIAFGVLLYMAFALMDVRFMPYLRRIWGIPACALASIVVGLVSHYLIAEMALGVRLVGAAAPSIGTFVVLLAYTQGISVRAVRRSLKTGA